MGLDAVWNSDGFWHPDTRWYLTVAARLTPIRVSGCQLRASAALAPYLAPCHLAKNIRKQGFICFTLFAPAPEVYLPSDPGQLIRLFHHLVQHLCSQPSRKGVLLAWMIAAQKKVRTHCDLLLVAEDRPRRKRPPKLFQRPQCAVPREPSQTHDHLYFREYPQFFHQVAEAIVALHDSRPVRRRCTTYTGGNVAIAQPKTVIPTDGLGLICQSGPVQGGIEPVARTVTGKNPSRSVATMSGGRQAADEDARTRIAKARKGLPPIFLISKCGSLFARDLLAPTNQPGAPFADNNLAIQLG
jgi:hypothetical protein